jgi:hypothetical protein
MISSSHQTAHDQFNGGKKKTQVWKGKSHRVKTNGVESDNGNSCPNEMIFNKFTKKNLSADGERVHCAHKLLMSTHTKTNTKPYVISSISRYFKSLNDKLNLKKETFFFANQRTSCQRPRRPYTGTVRATHSLTHDDRYIVLPHPSKKKRIFLFWVGPILPLFFF